MASARPGEKAYQGDYTKPRLRNWAKKIEAWHADLKSIYFYFDNDQAGYAAKNAPSSSACSWTMTSKRIRTASKFPRAFALAYEYVLSLQVVDSHFSIGFWS